MSTEISWVFEVTVKPDAVDKFSALIREAVADDQGAGTRLPLECFIDGQDAHFDERYQDMAAALTHLQRFGENNASRLFALPIPGRLSVYGEPSCQRPSACRRWWPGKSLHPSVIFSSW